jgi:hypothetical protein
MSARKQKKGWAMRPKIMLWVLLVFLPGIVFTQTPTNTIFYIGIGNDVDDARRLPCFTRFTTGMKPG